MFCITDFLQHLDSDFNAGGNFRDSFCSNASTDAGVEVSFALEKARMSMEPRRAQEQDKMKGSQILAVEDIRKL